MRSYGLLQYFQGKYMMYANNNINVIVVDTNGTWYPNFIPWSIRNTYVGNNEGFYPYADGRILYIGSWVSSNNSFQGRKRILRVLPNGSYDTTFNHNCNQTITRILPVSNNKLLLYTPFGSLYDGVSIGRLFKIDTTGQLDTTFRTNLPGGELKPLYEDSLGRIYVGSGSITGLTNPNNPSDTSFLIRLLPNGRLDTTFNNFGHFDHISSSAEVLKPGPGNRLLIGGFILSYQGHPVNHFVITDENGFYDSLAMQGMVGANLFDTSQGPDINSIYAIEREPLGSYLVAGTFNPLYALENLKGGSSTSRF